MVKTHKDIKIWQEISKLKKFQKAKGYGQK